MTPEAERYLAKAVLILEHARAMLGINLTEDAGRAAYLASYQAAEAFISERTGRIAKTHSGAHREFARLAMRESRIDDELRRFLPQAYNLKAICDYELGPDAIVPYEKAAAAIETAARFVKCLTAILSDAEKP